MRQMTFEIPDEIAEQFASEVPVHERSRVVTQLILHRRPRRRLSDQEWIAACEAANAVPSVAELEKDWEVTVADGLNEEPNDW